MDILYKGCPNANNLTHCEPVSCNKFNEVLYSDKLVVTVQGTFAFIFFLIFIFCIAQTISDIKRSNIKSRRELKLFYSKTPTIILSLVGIGALSRCIYFIEKSFDHYTLRVWDDDEECCIASGGRIGTTVSTQMLKMVRDIAFSCSFMLLVQSWIAVQLALLPKNKRQGGKYSKRRFVLVILTYCLLRVLECVFRIVHTLTKKQYKGVYYLSFIFRGLTMVLYALVFAYALPFGFGMLKRLNLALQKTSSYTDTSIGPNNHNNSQNMNRKKKKETPIKRSFVVLRRFVMLMTFICIIFWLTHLAVTLLKEGHENMEYCSPHTYVYVKTPEKILECIMVVCLIVTLSNRNKAKRAASKYSRKSADKKNLQSHNRSDASGRVRTSFSSLAGNDGISFVSEYSTAVELTSEEVDMNIELIEVEEDGEKEEDDDDDDKQILTSSDSLNSIGNSSIEKNKRTKRLQYSNSWVENESNEKV